MFIYLLKSSAGGNVYMATFQSWEQNICYGFQWNLLITVPKEFIYFQNQN